MDEIEKEQKFDAIYMAIQHGYITAARSAFEASLQIAVDEKLDQIINIFEKKGAHCLIEDIQKLKHSIN